MIVLSESKTKWKHIIREDDTIIATHSTYHKIISDYHAKKYERMYVSLSSSLKIQNTRYIFTLTVMMMIWQSKNLRSFVETYGVKVNITLSQSI